MDIAYAAHTSSCIFMLDEEGICRWVVTRGAHVSRQTVENAQRCIGAQYVASLDMTTPGGLLPAPRIGAQMLFAVVSDDGRIALARSGTVTRFEDRRPGAAAGGRLSSPTLPYDAFGIGSGARPLPQAEASQSLEIDVDYVPEATLDDDETEERTRLYPDRKSGHRASTPPPQRRSSSPPPPESRPRATRMPDGPSAVPPPARDPHRCETGRYLPIEARALRHLARLKK